MQADSTVEEIVNSIKRFRILCVGKTGVGKSSLINRVFRIDKALVSDGLPGEADIEKEFTSPENDFFVLHDSKGFETSDTETIDAACKFIEERRNEDLPLEKRLHAIWLCTRAPTAGGRVLENGDERLLELAHKTNTPVVVVVSQYDMLVDSKNEEVREDAERSGEDLDEETLDRRSKEEIQQVLSECKGCLEEATGELNIPMVPYVPISISEGYNDTILSLVQVTCEHVRDKLKGDAVNTWIMWVTAQRVDLPLKVRTCTDKAMDYYGRSLFGSAPGFGNMLLRDCIGKVHQEIVTCWNFRDDEKILSSDAFKQVILYLVRDVHESKNQNQSQPTLSGAIDTASKSVSLVTTVATAGPAALPVAILGLTGYLLNWLSSAVLENIPKVQRHLMAYTVDLIKVLVSLFDYTTTTITAEASGKPTFDLLEEAFQDYGRSASCVAIHQSIREKTQRNLDSSDFRITLCELLEIKWIPERQ